MNGSNGHRTDCDNPDLDDWSVADFTNLRSDSGKFERGEEIIQGFLRDGEVCLLVAASKDGKSWMAGQLAWCIATGTPFLGLNVKQGSVLLIDNELKQREIDFRHSQIVKALQHNPQVGEVTVVCRRGKSSDVTLLASKLKTMDLSGYSLIVIDALYKIIPDGRSENDNEGMGKLMNMLQNIADATAVPIVIVHHTTKGDQSNKSTLDLAAGAGSFGRSLDAMIAIRDHETEGHNVCEFKARTNKPMEPLSVKFEFPLWYATTLSPEIRKSGGSAELQRKRDAEADALVLKVLTDGKKPLSSSEIRGKTGMGKDRVTRSINRLTDAKKLVSKRMKSKSTGKSTERWKLADCTDGCTDGCTDNRTDN